MNRELAMTDQDFEDMAILADDIEEFVDVGNEYISGMALLMATASHCVDNNIPKATAASILKSLMDDYLKNKIANMKKVHKTK